MKKKTQKPKAVSLDTRRLQVDTAALKLLSDLEELVNVPPERGGVYFSDWEKQFIASVRAQFDELPEFTVAQRDKLKEIWHAVDLRKREEPEEKTQNLFSKLSSKEQARQRERAAKVKLPWEQ